MAPRKGARAAAAAAAASADDEPPAQITDYAYNVFGYAFQHPTEHRDGIVYINARAETTKTYKEALEKFDSSKGPESRLELELTDKEKAAEPEIGHYQYLLVGWVPHDLDATQTSKNEPKVNKKFPPGTNTLKSEDIIKYSDERLPLMAVVKVTEECPEKTSSFVLLQQSHGVCTPYTVQQPHIFYLPQFRSNVTTVKARGSAWNRLIHKHSVINDRPMSLKQRQFQRARDQSKLVFDPPTSLKNEISTLLACYQHSNNEVFISELESVLKSVDGDLGFMPMVNDSLRIFINGEDLKTIPFEIEDARKMLQEIELIWPDVQAKPEQILLLKQGMAQEKVIVEYRHAKAFIQYAVYRMNEQQVSENDVVAASNIAKAAMVDIQLLLGYQESPLAISSDDQRRLLSAIKRKLKEVVRDGSDFGKMAKDAAGDPALVCNYQDIWGTFANSLDTDTARAAFMEIVRLLVSVFRQAAGEVFSILEEIVERLEDAKISD